MNEIMNKEVINESEIDLMISQEARDFIASVVDCGELRIDVKKSGCSGLSYDIDMAKEVTENDHIIPVAPGVAFIIDKTIWVKYLKGIRVELAQSQYGESLRFVNPNARNSCGCGDSFSVDE